MSYLKSAILSMFLLVILSSCKKEAAGAFYESKSGNVKIEVTGTQVPLDPWLVTVSVSLNNKPFYELSNIEVYASTIDENTVSFNWLDGVCTIQIKQTDGNLFPIPIVRLPVE